MKLVFDIETNGLYHEATKIWCICAKDLDTGEKYEWTVEKDQCIKNFLKLLENSEELVGHNIINYDLPVLKKIINWEPNENTKITDTLVMSRLANPDRTKPSGYTGKAGPNSLEVWGYRVGKGKLYHEDWNVFSTDMLRRCREDVEINELVYHRVSYELEDFSQESIQLEHDVAKIITEQEYYGIRFDYERAKQYVEDLTAMIDEIDIEILPKLPKELEVIGAPVMNPFLKTGGLRKQVRDYIDGNNLDRYDNRLGFNVGGPFTRLRFSEFDVNSVSKIKNYLLASGWEPEFWNFSKTTGERTSPKMAGEFRGVSGEIPSRVRDRITIRHRRSQIEGWIKNARYNPDLDCYTLSPGANTCGTNTGRFTHHEVVNIPKANSNKETGELVWDTKVQKVFFGTQMRSLFIPRDEYKIVGHDASGLELRMLANYMNDEEFTRQILDGDIHTFNQEKAGLETRDAAKTFIYALIYGAGDAKIGSIVHGDSNDGKLVKERYFVSLPKLEQFIERVKRASGKGWLRGLDGRRIYMRKNDRGQVDRKKAPNTLLQSAGAIVMKKSLVLLWESIKQAQIDAHKVLDMHDEGQSEVRDDPKVLELYSKLAVKSIEDAGKHFKLNIPLAAEVKIGNNMAETH